MSYWIPFSCLGFTVRLSLLTGTLNLTEPLLQYNVINTCFSHYDTSKCVLSKGSIEETKARQGLHPKYFPLFLTFPVHKKICVLTRLKTVQGVCHERRLWWYAKCFSIESGNFETRSFLSIFWDKLVSASAQAKKTTSSF